MSLVPAVVLVVPHMSVMRRMPEDREREVVVKGEGGSRAEKSGERGSSEDGELTEGHAPWFRASTNDCPGCLGEPGRLYE